MPDCKRYDPPSVCIAKGCWVDYSNFGTCVQPASQEPKNMTTRMTVWGGGVGGGSRHGMVLGLLGNRFSPGGSPYTGGTAPLPGPSASPTLPSWVCAIAAGLGIACNPAALVAAGLGYLIGATSSTPPANPEQCPEGTIPTGDDTLPCAAPGSPGFNTVQPGGGAVLGVFGVPAVAPQVVGERMNASGQTTLIRQCPRGTVLGKDNMCYAKGSIPPKYRKWRPTPKPPVTRSDAVAITRAAAAKNRVKALAEKVDFKCTKK